MGFSFFNQSELKMKSRLRGIIRRGKRKRTGYLPVLDDFIDEKFGVADGTRTHDNRNHNPGLYQLSYSHH
jgi:hypothetical protein